MKIRIVNVDFYMGTPIANLDIFYSEFRGSSVNQVPVIRIYGSTEEGQKICLHVHGVFPYIYIPYEGETASDGLLYQIASGLDKAINLSLGQTSSNVQHVYKVSLVSGIPLYGYHAKQHQYLKLYFYNPLIIKKACALLQNGSICGKIYQPHEAHIPYILQFMMDYNLHGMSFVELGDIKYRVDPSLQNDYSESSILPLSIQKMSVCKIEGDTQADSILNRYEISSGNLTVNPGIKVLWDDEKQRRRTNEESSLIEHCLTQNRIDIPPTATHIAYKTVLEEKLKTKFEDDDASPQSNLSVYPAETPPSSDLLEASMIENHLSSQDISCIDVTVTEDENAQQLYELLKDLKEDISDGDSILSQVRKEHESDNEEEMDLSLPLNATQTPKKMDSNSEDLQEFLKDSYFNTLGNMPQLDGTCDELSETKLPVGGKFNVGQRVHKKNATQKGQRNKFKVKTSGLFRKITLKKLVKIPCKDCCCDTRPSVLHGKTQVCIKRFLYKIKEVDETKSNVESVQIESAHEKKEIHVNLSGVDSSINEELFQDYLSCEAQNITFDLDFLTKHSDEGEFLTQSLAEFDMPLLCDVNENTNTKCHSSLLYPTNSEDNLHSVDNDQNRCASKADYKNQHFVVEDKNNNSNKSTNVQTLTCNVSVGSKSKRGRKRLSRGQAGENSINKENASNTIHQIKKEVHQQTFAQCSKFVSTSTYTSNYNLRSQSTLRKALTDVNTTNTVKRKNKSTRKLKVTKSKKKSVRSVKTQTKPMKTSPLGRKQKKPRLNFILTRIEGKQDEYDVQVCTIGKAEKKYYDLGLNPNVKFRIVPGKQPHSFNTTNYRKYPNTTWHATPDTNNNARIARERSNSIVLKSNYVLNGSDKYEESLLKKGKAVDVIQFKTDMSIKHKPEQLEKNKGDNLEFAALKDLSSSQEEVLNDIVRVYDEINHNINENVNTLACASPPLDMAKIFESIDAIDNPENSSDEIDGGRVETTDCANKEKGFESNREVLKKQHTQLIERIEKSFNDLFNNTKSITNGNVISTKLILDHVNSNQPSKKLESVSFDKTRQVHCCSSESFSSFSGKIVRIEKFQNSKFVPDHFTTHQLDEKITQEGCSNVIKEQNNSNGAKSKGKHGQIIALNPPFEKLRTDAKITSNASMDLAIISRPLPSGNLNFRKSISDNTRELDLHTKLSNKHETTNTSALLKRFHFRRNLDMSRLHGISKVDPINEKVRNCNVDNFKSNTVNNARKSLKPSLLLRNLNYPSHKLDDLRALTSSEVEPQNVATKLTSREVDMDTSIINNRKCLFLCESVLNHQICKIPQADKCTKVDNHKHKTNTFNDCCDEGAICSSCSENHCNNGFGLVVTYEREDFHKHVHFKNIRKSPKACKVQNGAAISTSNTTSSFRNHETNVGASAVLGPRGKHKSKLENKIKFSKSIKILEKLIGLSSKTQSLIQYKDVDERIENYKLFKKHLKHSHKNNHLTSDSLLANGNVCKICYTQIRRYTFQSMNNSKLNSPFNNLYLDLNCNETTPWSHHPSMTATSNVILQQPNMMNYVADSNNSHSNGSHVIGSTTSQATKMKKSRKNLLSVVSFPVNQLKYLDGANDSSEEDESIKTAMKKVRKLSKKSSPQTSKYSPLKVEFRSSPSKSLPVATATNLQNRLNVPSISIEKQHLPQRSEIQQMTSQRKLKRKLSFSRISPLNQTKVEEGLGCCYRSFTKKASQEIVNIRDDLPVQIMDISYKFDQKNTPSDKCASEELTPYQKVTSKTVDSQNLECIQISDSSDSLSDDIFSLNSQDLSLPDICSKDPAEIYDVRNKFVPLPGGSRFTFDLVATANRSLSDSDKDVMLSVGERLLAKISDNSERSSTSDITPYQKQDSDENVAKIDKNFTLASGDHKSTHVRPYQMDRATIFKTKANLSVCDYFKESTLATSGPVVIVPKFNPPTRAFVGSTMEESDIPEIRHQEPFYSDVKDVAGCVEVGVKVLRITSNKMVDLPVFQSNFNGIDWHRRSVLESLYPREKITTKDIRNYKMSFCQGGDFVITPVRLPPTRDSVRSWLENKLGTKTDIMKTSGKKKKVFIPCSPDGDNEDSDNSMTISPCTPGDDTVDTIKDESPKENTVIENQLENTATSGLSKKSLKVSDLDLTKNKNSYQVTGVTFDNTHNFAMSKDNLQDAKALKEYLHLTIMCIELIIETRGDYKPNPSHDSVKGIIYKVFNDVPEDDSERSKIGCFLLNKIPTSPVKTKFSVLDGVVLNTDVTLVETEEDLFKQFLAFVTESDPDIFVGYEIEMLSWGYLIERGYILNFNLIPLLSRIPNFVRSKTEEGLSDLRIPGRILLDFWRLLRHEIALQSYSFENIVYHILHERVPLYSFKDITYWWNHPSPLYRNNVLRYYLYRVESIMRIAEQLDLIGRTSEMAKLFGIQFFEVLSRGSQFRVESMMLRLAKPLNYIPVSPSVQQKAKMRAPESLPLIMEPESKYYADPVIVLDFQSLYPSMIIAYNLCFSTCLGRIEHLGRNGAFEFGATQLKVPKRSVKYLHGKDRINISPCGVGFVKKEVREGILPRMLQEILDTRLMVKKSLKRNSRNRTLQKVLDARQLGLKLIANVTYGYTAANYSGRMPCVEVADSVVSKGRETLQRAIDLVEKTSKWHARVVYGDTDSLFVLVVGRSKEDAFKIGAEIAEAVTSANPSPVRLKLEKIFHPCVLQTKKRYVGYMYESADQTEPEYCAKGIETVRRDGCPAVSKMLEKCLKILFDTRDVSLIRQYVVRQFSKILSGRISIQDLTFAKEYRGSASYRPGACVPALELARKWMAVDTRSEPRRGERVPYVIINGPPGLPLIRLVRSPRELIADPSLRPNALYYITKVIIPPLNRCFLLIGADVNNWFNEMPRKQFQYHLRSSPIKGKKSTISQYFSTTNCAICGQQSREGLCDTCLSKTRDTSIILHEKVRLLEKHYFAAKMMCESCCGTTDKVVCVSLDCPVYYKRVQAEKEFQQAPFIRELILMLPDAEC